MAKKSNQRVLEQSAPLATKTTLSVPVRIFLILLLPFALTLILGGGEGSNAGADWG